MRKVKNTDHVTGHNQCQGRCLPVVSNGENQGHWLSCCRRGVVQVVGGIALLTILGGCILPRPAVNYHDPMMDFALVKRVAIMPLENLSRDAQAEERVRDTLTTMILATEALYVVPPGEVARGVGQVNILNPVQPSTEEIKKFATAIEVDAVLTGVVTEYGQVRAGSSEANVVAISLKMMDAQSGEVIWSGSTTKGGISLADRLFGGGGKPIIKTTQEAVDELLNQLFN